MLIHQSNPIRSDSGENYHKILINFLIDSLIIKEIYSFLAQKSVNIENKPGNSSGVSSETTLSNLW